MIREFSLGVASLVLIVAPTTAMAASFGFHLNLTVAVRCTVQHQPTGFGTISGGAVSLGTFREYCNAPAGYDLVVNYAPGSMAGARVIAGNDEIVLNGSGRAVLSRSTGPRVRERMIAAVPGANGFDTDRLELTIVPS
jgi:hypothetical protein